MRARTNEIPGGGTFPNAGASESCILRGVKVDALKPVGQSIAILVLGIPTLLVIVALIGWILTVLWEAFIGPAPKL